MQAADSVYLNVDQGIFYCWGALTAACYNIMLSSMGKYDLDNLFWIRHLEQMVVSRVLSSFLSTMAIEALVFWEF